MSEAQWQKAYNDAWAAYYSPEYFETVMRREYATEGRPGKLLTLLIWSYGSIMLEGMHPYQRGYLRRKYPADRRPSLPAGSPFAFYPRLLSGLVSMPFKL